MTTVSALTSEQYNQLMQVLSKYNIEQGQGSDDVTTTVGFLAGKTIFSLLLLIITHGLWTMGPVII